MKIKVDSSDIRIDKYLSNELDYSREYITKLIKDGHILVNCKSVKPSYKVCVDDEIDIDDNVSYKQDIDPVEMNLDIIYEDEDIMVINKPSGLTVHPGAGNKNNTLVNGLKYYTEELSDVSGDERVGIVHRLDKDTSGLMLVAKSNKAHEILSDMFKRHEVVREYYALLVGNFPASTARVDAPIGRSKDNFQKMEVNKNGKDAVTNLKVLKKYDGYTLVSLILETGRTHQIRVHMKYIGYPIYNDPVYWNNNSTEFGQFLHSKKITFNHPITNKKMEFECDLPEYFDSFLKKLDEK